jgi:glycosyltransferase involved in cell wall biosynthesis
MSGFADTPRNAPCPCGSGKRYKHCHGVAPPAAASAPAPVDALMRRALEAQQARRYDEAERAYRDVLSVRPDEADALHMLGVLRHERGDDEEATALVMRALDLTGWRIPFMRSNLGIILAARGGDTDADEVAAMSARHAAMLAARRAAKRPARPRVSIVVPAYNHARYVERALASALAQTWRDLEIVLVDDGSSDATADVAERTLAGGARPHRIVRRANRGAPHTLNEGAALATGEYLQFLNSDDWLEPTRVERMVDEVAGVGASWGYSAVSLVDGDGAPVDVMSNRRAFDLMVAQSAIGFRLSVGFSLVPGNTAVSTGNLFAARAFFDRVGGFRDFRWNHDWDFALRSTWLEEPVFVDSPLYAYRLHAANTIDEAAGRSRAEMADITGDYLARALDERAQPENPFAPAIATWGSAFLNVLLGSGIGGVVDPALLREVALTKLRRSRLRSPVPLA